MHSSLYIRMFHCRATPVSAVNYGNVFYSHNHALTFAGLKEEDRDFD